MSDHVRLGAVARWVSPELVAEALDDCGVRDKKPGALPARFMVYFTLALALFQHDSCDDVAGHMAGGVPELAGSIPELAGSIPGKSSFTRARQRLGAQAIERVFRKLTGPLAPAGLEGSFYRGMRLAAVDGFVLDAPETEANRRRLGGPKDARGQVAGFPQVRVVTLTETGTHAQTGAAVDGACCGEPELAIRLAPSAAGMLVIMDRGFPGVALWRAYTGAGAHLLIRARSCVAAHPVEYLPDGTCLARMNLAGQKRAAPGHVVLRVIEYHVDDGEVIRLLTDLPGHEAYPATELAALYRERWEAESSYRQVKTFQRGPQLVLRSASPELACQEAWAHLVIHHCLIRIIMELAAGAGIDPDRISFLKVLKHVRRSVIAQTVTTAAKMMDFMDMLASRVDRKPGSGPRRPRVADRLLKRQNSKYSYRAKGQQLRPTRSAPARTITLHPALLQ